MKTVMKTVIVLTSMAGLWGCSNAGKKASKTPDAFPRSITINVMGVKRPVSITLKNETKHLEVDQNVTFNTKILDRQPYQLSYQTSMFQDCHTDGLDAGVIDQQDLILDVICRSVSYFAADDGITNNELWRSDGTAQGTYLTKDINPNGHSNPNHMFEFNEHLYFSADNGDLGQELWRSDGSEAGTVLFKDINPDAPGSNVNSVIIANGKFFFLAETASDGIEVWASDGEPQGTHLTQNVHHSANFSGPTELTLVGNNLYFIARDAAHNFQLWLTTGEPGNAVHLTQNSVNSTIQNLTAYDGSLYFSATFPPPSPQLGFDTELWVSNGTVDGTGLFKNINTATGVSDRQSYPSELTVSGGLLFFIAKETIQNGIQLWKSNGTPAGTTKVRPDLNIVQPSQVTAYKNGVLFKAFIQNFGYELYFSDGGDGTWSKDLNIGSGSSDPHQFVAVGSKMYFTANNGSHGKELWSTDGTPDGTLYTKNINLTGDANPSNFSVIQEKLVFKATVDGSPQSWVSDGSENGTMMLIDLGMFTLNDKTQLEKVSSDDRKVLFVVNDGINGRELWTTEGSPESTVMVKNINEKSNGGSEARGFFSWNQYVFFTATDAVNGHELWVTRGTEDSTMMLGDIKQGLDSSNPRLFTQTAKGAVFAADGPNGRELYVSNGTPVGTRELLDIYPGPASSNPSDFVVVGDLVYFIATDEVGFQFWKTDGTTVGTTIMTIIADANRDNAPWTLTAVGSSIYFMAPFGGIGSEPLQRYETLNGNLTTFTDTARPFNFKAVGDDLYFQNFGASDLVRSRRNLDTLVAIWPNSVESSANTYHAFENTVFFRAFPPEPNFYQITPTATTPTALFDSATHATIWPLSPEGPMLATASELYFVSNGELMKLQFSDKSVTSLFSGGNQYLDFHLVNGNFYFRENSIGEYRLRTITNNTESVVVPNQVSWSTPFSARFTDLLVFSSQSDTGNELWRVKDMVPELIKDINPLKGESSNPIFKHTHNSNYFIFLADDGVRGVEPWVSSGEIGDALILKDINQIGHAFSN